MTYNMTNDICTYVYNYHIESIIFRNQLKLQYYLLYFLLYRTLLVMYTHMFCEKFYHMIRIFIETHISL